MAFETEWIEASGRQTDYNERKAAAERKNASFQMLVRRHFFHLSHTCAIKAMFIINNL